MEEIDTLIIGAGVIGLAVARALALAGREVIVVDAGGAIGTETSSRNSEVIHAGIYYPKGSLKARLCVAGREALYRYCKDRHIAHRRLGKLIVATDVSQVERLEGIRQQAQANGVEDLRFLSATEARALEPALECAAALLSPSTGIIDSHGLMLSLQGEAEDGGAAIALHSLFEAGTVRDGGFEVTVGGSEPMTLACRALVNAAGLGAWDVARALDGMPLERVPGRWLAKGSYFALGSGRAPFRHLIYPVPEDGGLGVHLTLDLAGQARFGPDVEWLPDGPFDYAVAENRAESFYASIRRYWPGLEDDALVPAYCGVRPKVSGPGMPAGDFMIQGPEAHGIAGLVNLFGIESPGLTACLAIAEEAVARLARTGSRPPST